MNSNELSPKPSANRTLLFLGLLVSLVGFLDASYLTIIYFRGALPDCTIVRGCDQVLSSPYATVFAAPVALLGALYYLGIFLGLGMYLDCKRESVLKITALGTTAGLVASAYFLYLQLVVLKAWCQFCIVSIFTSTVLFIIGMMLYRSLSKRP